MGLLRGGFGRERAKRLLPRGAPEILESFGRHEGPAPGGDMAAGLEFGQAVKRALTVDPERVMDEMVEACDAIGGWSYYGAWDILSAYAPDREEDPRYVHIVDGLLDTLKAEGYGPGDIPMILTPRAIARERAAQQASPQSQNVAESEPVIPPLADGERRLLKIIGRPDGNENRVYLIHRRSEDLEGYKFVAVIQSSDEPDFDFDTTFGWQVGEDERTVYIRIAEAYVNGQTAQCTYWLEPAVQWFADRVR